MAYYKEPTTFLINNSQTICLSLAVLIVILCYGVHRIFKASHIPSSIPWISDDFVKGPLSRIRAPFLDLSQGRKWATEGYHKYGIHGKPFVLPKATMRPVVVLPPDQSRWLMALPDTVVSHWQPLIHMLGIHFTMTAGKSFVELPDTVHMYHVRTIKQQLTRNIPKLLPRMVHELEAALDKRWGVDTNNWKEVTLETVTDTIVQVICATFVTESLSREEDYIQLSKKYTALAGQLGVLSGSILPRVLSPLLGPVLTYPAQYLGHKYDAMVLPLVKQRLFDSIERRAAVAVEKAEAPFDFLQWLIDDALDREPAIQQTPEALASRVSLMHFVSNHTTSIHMISAIVDISFGTQANANWNLIRQEAKTALAENGGNWSSDLFRNMPIVNSALRESMRLNSPRATANEKLIVAKEGLTLPSGEHLTYETEVVTSLLGRHTDSTIYDKPHEYQLLRFVDGDSVNSTMLTDDAESKSFNNGLLATTPSKDFMPFGNGRHACPGRFFAAQEIRLLISIIALRYDIEPLKERPARIGLGVDSFPDIKTKIRVRRRQN